MTAKKEKAAPGVVGPKVMHHPKGYWYIDLPGFVVHLGKKHGHGRLVFTKGDWTFGTVLGADE